MFSLNKKFGIMNYNKDIRNGGLNMLKEFKKFAMRGNVIDLAVGIIIGGAFSKIVTSLVNEIISPLIGILLGGINLSDKVQPIIGTKVILKYGLFLQSVIDFLIISFSIFIIIKGINSLKRKQDKEEKAEEVIVVASKEEILLAEIRDLLKKQQSS
jgi:large conductance mechanosensitive channel